MNTDPRTPVCGNCGKSETLCDADLYIDGETCCSWCEHPRVDERRLMMARLKAGA